MFSLGIGSDTGLVRNKFRCRFSKGTGLDTGFVKKQVQIQV